MELSQVQQQNGHGKAMTNCFFQSCHDHSQSTFPLSQAELPFNLHTVGLILIITLFVPLFILSRTSQSRAGQANVMSRTIAEILAVSIDFVRQHTLWIPACTSPIALNHFRQILCFIVGIKTIIFQSCPAIAHADIQLGTKLHTSFSLAALAVSPIACPDELSSFSLWYSDYDADTAAAGRCIGESSLHPACGTGPV